MRHTTTWLVWMGLLACGPVSPGSDGSGAGSSSSGEAVVTTGAVTTTGAVMTIAGTTGGVGGSSTDSPADTAGSMSSESGEGFLAPMDLGRGGACDVFSQNCPPGEKCIPYADDGGSSWNADKCVPVMENPAQVGESCFAPDGGVAGIDNCDFGLMCWSVDPEGNGHCVELCKGSLEQQMCDTPCTTCAVYAGATLALCLSACDPLQQNCDASDVCIENVNGEGFLCVGDLSGDAGQAHDPCLFANECDPGLMCGDPNAAVECDPDAEGCCEPFCDISDPDADSKCPGVGQVCNPYFEEGMAPLCWQNVGFCAVPR